MTDPTAPFLPDANRWYTVATDAEALSLPGGALLRVAASSIGHGGIVFVPGVVVEPIGHSHHGYARIVAAPGQSVIVDQMNLGARSTWADVAKTLEERMPPREAGRHADPSTAASRPVSELHLRPPTAQGVGPADKLATAQALASPPPASRGPTIAAKLRHGEYFEVLGTTFRVDAGPDGRIVLLAIDPEPDESTVAVPMEPAPKPACTCASDLRMAAGMLRQAARIDDPASVERCRIAAGYELAADLLETPELG